METPDPGFAPANSTDGRQLLDWHSKYTDSKARKGIYGEACYLAAIFFAVPLLVPNNI